MENSPLCPIGHLPLRVRCPKAHNPPISFAFSEEKAFAVAHASPDIDSKYSQTSGLGISFAFRPEARIRLADDSFVILTFPAREILSGGSVTLHVTRYRAGIAIACVSDPVADPVADSRTICFLAPVSDSIAGYVFSHIAGRRNESAASIVVFV